MCAIFGALISDLSTGSRKYKINKILTHIMYESRARGRDGFGWSSLSYEKHLKGDEYKEIGHNVDRHIGGILSHLYGPNKWVSIIGNFRAEPTTEFVLKKNTTDQQPYELNDWSIVHNGVIANDRELRTNELDTSIDSAAIVEALNAQSDMFEFDYSSFYKTVKMISGSYAILAQNKKDPESIMIACNYRPIWYAESDGAVYFASSADYFPDYLIPQEFPPYSTGYFTFKDGKLEKSFTTLREDLNSKKALVVASGGLDSTVATAELIKQGYEVELLHLQYGCKSQNQEENAIRNIAGYFEVPLRTLEMPIYEAEDSNLLNDEVDIAGGEEGAEFAHEWVPARNLVMLSMATAYAEAKGFDYIALGNNLEEAGAYPDNEPEFIRKFNKLLPYAIGDGKQLEVLMPVGDLMKHEIVKLGLENNAPMHLTWSCYKNEELHCGQCGPCFMRRTAFEINGATETIYYKDKK